MGQYFPGFSADSPSTPLSTTPPQLSAAEREEEELNLDMNPILNPLPTDDKDPNEHNANQDIKDLALAGFDSESSGERGERSDSRGGSGGDGNNGGDIASELDTAHDHQLKHDRVGVEHSLTCPHGDLLTFWKKPSFADINYVSPFAAVGPVDKYVTFEPGTVWATRDTNRVTHTPLPIIPVSSSIK